MQKKKLFLFDIMPLLYRAHFATMGKSFGTSTGIDTRTTLVFYNYIFQVLTGENPDAVAAALDSKPKGRVAVSSVYKANREKMPSEISDAFSYAMRLLDSLHIPILKEAGYEADDVIASLAKQGAARGYTVFIVSPDKDFAQLVTDNIFLFRPAYKGAVMETLDAVGVKNKYGVSPAQIADFLALRGDSVDNIVGVKGIGDKTAAQLLSEFQSVEQLIEEVGKIKHEKVKTAIVDYKDQLLQNKQLALLSGDLDVTFKWDNMVVDAPDEDKLLPLLHELQFVRIKERLAKQGFIRVEDVVDGYSETPKTAVTKLKPEEAIQKFKDKKTIIVGFLEQFPDRLFLVGEDDNQLIEVVIDGEREWKELIGFFDSDHYSKIGWQLKSFLKKLMLVDITLKSQWVDLSIVAYLLEPDAKIEWPYVNDKYQLTEAEVGAPYSSLKYLLSISEASKKMMSRMDEMNLSRLFFNIESPLQHVIAKMEAHGLRIDLAALDEIDKVLKGQLDELEMKLYETAAARFNISSPSQTAQILQKIADPSELKKTKTGQISTAEPHLAELASKYPFVEDLLLYRKLNKIITTYVYSLPKYIDPVTNKVHPTFQQAVAGTGRIICTEPNLQNLPVKSEAGREVRKAIIASTAGNSILSVDYNQVELRLLAALSNDVVMIETFRSGKDIHTTTASRVFDVDESAVTKDMRNKAKGINFGIAYGITAWGLSTRLKISQKEAKQIIDAYFDEFSSVKEYLERSVRESRERGYTKTLYGRIRYIEGISSPNGTTRKIAERVAVNAPLQGLAADIIKEAMVSIDQFIASHNFQSRLILQVHDELVFDAADEELPVLVPEVIKLMETKAALAVPLKVQVTVGKNWLDQAPYFGSIYSNLPGNSNLS